MDKTVATKLMDVFEDIGISLNKATHIVNELPDVDEQKVMRRGLGEFMGRLFTDLQLHIIRQHPDLDPDNKLNTKD
jgi:hypothetical protein